MELKIFRDTLPQAGTSCTVKAELPLETEILISDYLQLVKCFAKPVVLQKQLQPGRLTLEGYLRCTVFYQGEDGAGLCQTEQKLPFTKQLEKVANFVIRSDSRSKKLKKEPVFLDERLLNTPSFAASECNNMTVKMAYMARDNILLSIDLLQKFDKKLIERV